jgi:hypothetical protein
MTSEAIAIPTALGEMEETAERIHWGLATRISFRFAFAYLGLYTLTFPAGFFLPYTNWLLIKVFQFWYKAVPWFALHVLHFRLPISTEFMPPLERGSGDTLYDWVQIVLILVVAVLATVIWSVWDRKRKNYVTLHKWFRLWVRFSLLLTMLVYGASKAIPNQMGPPDLMKLLETYGKSSLMGILWTSIGASTSYTIFAGCVELLGGILLIFPRTTLAGGLVSAAAMAQVFMLNMCYDVPVKIFSFHSILLALFIVAPDVPRLLNILALNHPVGPSTIPPLFRRRWVNWIAVALQVVLGFYILGKQLKDEAATHKEYYGVPKSPFYGIWDVENFFIDGQERPPLLTDRERWRRVVMDYPTSILIQNMTEDFSKDFYMNFRGYGMKLDMPNKKFTLKKGRDSAPENFSYEQPSPDELVWDGTLQGHKIHAELHRLDMSDFLLVSRGFHWVQEEPFNR